MTERADASDGGTAVRFCTIADSAHYVGLVALVNSLRLHGHDDPITVLDVGLTDAERAELAPHCDVVDPPGPGRHAWLLAPHACLARPATVVVSVDADVIVTAPLDAILARARDGKICAFPDPLRTRWFGEWEHEFALPGPPRRQPYVNTGFVAFSTRAFPELLGEWAARCDAVSVVPTTAPPLDLGDPLALADQDSFNALLMSVVPAERLSVQPRAEAVQGPWALTQTHVDDLRTLACSLDGTPITLLHSFGSPKPWHAQPGRYLRASAYLLCLRRLLVGDDVALRSEVRRVPWLAPGLRGELALRSRTTLTSVWGWGRRRFGRA